MSDELGSTARPGLSAARPDLEASATHDTETLSPLGRAPTPDYGDHEFKQLLRAQLFGKAAEPLRIGRFTVLRELGAGGMGVVYAAYDDQLDRKVALKLLHAHRDAAHGSRRLLREAQALARLSHPNVVGIHEVGVFEDRVFLAMEFVHGQTAHHWRLARRRSVREIIDVYVQAGRGLAAAHAVGLAHGDFKPENVLVGADDRVRVLDFGLARLSDSTDPDVRETRPELSSRSGRLTMTGAIAGTPAYMAPEQLEGQRADARSDQFSFSIALFEALYGQRPFPGDNLDHLMASVLAGRIVIPADVSVPGWLRRVVLRGLAHEPGERWPGMTELLAALDRKPRRVRWLAAAGLALGVGAAAAGAAFGSGPDLCAGAAAELVGVWDPARRQAMQAAFLRVDTPFAAAAWARTEQLLDAHLRAWADMQRSSCEATHVRGTQSNALLDLRSACLHRRLEEVRALTDLFAAADAGVVERAPQAVGLLGAVATCGDVDALNSAVPLPTDPELRARVARLRARIDPVVALLRTGKYAEGRARASALVDEALELGYPPLTAEVRVLSGELRAAAGDFAAAEVELLEGARAAAAAGDDPRVALAWVRLVDLVGVCLARFSDGLAWARAADVALLRAGDDARLRAELLVHEGAILHKRGDYDDALVLLQRALALQERTLGPDDPALAATLDTIGLTLEELGDFAGAIAAHRRALALLERALGPDHPDVAVTLQRLGSALNSFGAHDEATAHTRRAFAVIRAALPADHPIAAGLEYEVGIEALGAHLFGEAGEHFAAALSAFTRSLGPDHPEVGRAHTGLAMTSFFLDRHEEARQHAEQARAILVAALGPDHPTTAYALDALGMALDGLGRPDEALAVYMDGLQARERRFGPDHPAVGLSHSNLANVMYELGRLDDTLAHDRRALEIAERNLGPDHRKLLSRHSNFALVLNERGKHGDSEEALQHYQRALAIAEKTYGPRSPEAATALASIGATYLKLKNPVEATGPLERALAIFDDTAATADPRDVAFARFNLARALWNSGADPRRSRELMLDARDRYTAIGPSSAEILREIDLWLSSPKQRAPDR